MTVTGVVSDGVDPVAGAIVCGIGHDDQGRIAMPTAECAVTDATGAFAIDTTLVTDAGTTTGQVVAGAVGYRTVDVTVPEGVTDGVSIALEALSMPDNPDYLWWRSTGDAVQTGCGQCHTVVTSQWQQGLHAIAATDPLVFDMYDGTDTMGMAGVAPGYKLDHDDAGDCAACHAPTANWSEGRPVDLHDVPPEHTDGVFCESCHKIRSVTLGAGPGADGAITYWRPPWDDGLGGSMQFAFGAYPNTLSRSMLTSYSPLMRKAELCASCHQYTNAQGVDVMDTFTDWQAVGDPEMTLPCQSCHMKDQFNLVPDDEDRMEWLVEDTYVELVRETSAQRRDPLDVYRHEMWGGEQYASHALDLQMNARLDGDEIAVHTSILNVGANHRVPTGMPFREVVLVVSAVADGAQEPLELVEGPVVGDERGGDLADQPGVMFAKSLGDADGNVTFAFWDATQLLEDSRLRTGESKDSEFRFRASTTGNVTVTARLLYHRFSQSLADAKGWDMGEQELDRKESVVEVGAPGQDGGASDGGADAGIDNDFEEGCTCRTLPGRAGRGSLVVLGAFVAIVVARRRSRSGSWG